MQHPEYITRDEVKRVCRKLGFRDWTKLQTSEVLPAEASAIQNILGAEAVQISTEVFQQGLEVELEHGLGFSDANVTNNHPVLTGKIVLAHLKEMLDYYQRLEVAELEGDVLKAISSGRQDKLKTLYKKLAEAKIVLAQAELQQLGE